MKKKPRITEAEWPIMEVLWTNGSATAAGISGAIYAERGIPVRTVKALLRRLVDKCAVGYTIDPDNSRIYHYRALMSREETFPESS